jgi:hypothetical protein
MFEGLIRLVSEHLPNANIATFSTTLAHAIGHNISKLAVKFVGKVTLKSILHSGGNMIKKLAISGTFSSLTTMAAAKGFGAAAAAIPTIAALITIGVVVTLDIEDFTRNPADKIAPKVRQIMPGEFGENNRTMLEEIGKDTMTDFGFQLAETLATHSGLTEHTKEAAKQMAKGKRHSSVLRFGRDDYTRGAVQASKYGL